MTTPLNIVFAGTPDFAAKHLAALLSSNHNIVGVYCPKDKPVGRGKKLTACAVKQLAVSHDIPVFQPDNFKSAETVTELAELNADVMVVVAYGLLLPPSVLSTPKFGCINVHGSILPEWRGAAPIQRAVEAGDPETGVTIMQMDKGLDTGDMLRIETCPIELTDTSASIYEKLSHIGPPALLAALDDIANGNSVATPQDNANASYANKLEKQEAKIDWQLPSTVIDQKVRAYIPWPVSYFEYSESDEKRHTIRVWQAKAKQSKSDALPGIIVAVSKDGIEVATGDGTLILMSLQLPGKKAMPVRDILNSKGHWFEPGNLITGAL